MLCFLVSALQLKLVFHRRITIIVLINNNNTGHWKSAKNCRPGMATSLTSCDESNIISLVCCVSLVCLGCFSGLFVV